MPASSRISGQNARKKEAPVRISSDARGISPSRPSLFSALDLSSCGVCDGSAASLRASRGGARSASWVDCDVAVFDMPRSRSSLAN